MSKLFIRRLLPFAALLTVLSSLAWALTSDQVETRIRNKINSKWKTTNLKINIKPLTDYDTSKGRFAAIGVSATSVVVHDVKLTDVNIAATDVTLDLNQLVRKNQVVTTRRKTGHFTARVSEADLNKALTLKKNSIENLHVALGTGKLTFTGKYKLGLSAKLKLEGRLESPDHYRVNFVPTKASVGGIPLPTGPLKTVLNKMNPLLDLKTIPLSPRINKILVTPGYLAMSG